MLERTTLAAVVAEALAKKDDAMAAMVADAKRAFARRAETNRVLEGTTPEASDPWTEAAEMVRELCGAVLPAFAAAATWTGKEPR